MECGVPAYRPRDAEHTVLHQVIAEHLESFLRAVAEAGDGAGLPQFVEREFREFLLCGVYEAGVARFQCEGCGLDHLLPFSCKGRAWCPSCGDPRTIRALPLSLGVRAQVGERAPPGFGTPPDPVPPILTRHPVRRSRHHNRPVVSASAPRRPADLDLRPPAGRTNPREPVARRRIG